jgi:hypothetical protein
MEELRRQQAELAKQQTKVRHLLYFVEVGLVTVILLFGIILTYIVMASQGNRETTCAVIETSRAERHAQLAAFEETPPTTPAGQGIQQAARDSLAAWDGLANQLSCKGSSHG